MAPANARDTTPYQQSTSTCMELGTAPLARPNAPSLPPRESFPNDSFPNFEELALPLFDSVYNFARWLAGSETDAEDLVQETYLKAFRGFAAFEPGTNFRAWIFRILKNTFLTSRTSARQRRTAVVDYDELLEKLPCDSPDPVAVLMDRARLDVVQTAMQRLPLIFREVLVLCDLEEASYRETAQALSIPVGTVMSRLARARKAVRQSIHTPHNHKEKPIHERQRFRPKPCSTDVHADGPHRICVSGS